MPTLINSQKLPSFKFSGGEVQVNVKGLNVFEEGEIIEVTALLYDSADIMEMIMGIDAIRRMAHNPKIHLVIPYFPYGRQDRVCNRGEAFGLEIMAKMVNQLGCEMVTIFDPHSSITEDLVKNCFIIKQKDMILNSQVERKIFEDGLQLVSPDAGALSKVLETSVALKIDLIPCLKKRDPQTGKILKTKIKGQVRGKDLIILDDICDGGRTFVELGKKLKEAGARNLYLYVTHGIFSKGFQELRKIFNHIYCYHIFPKANRPESSFLTIFKEYYHEN